ncbi:MAG: hypothetical protein MHMPM18_001227 [Marteilia pararefringens]
MLIAPPCRLLLLRQRRQQQRQLKNARLGQEASRIFAMLLEGALDMAIIVSGVVTKEAAAAATSSS